MDVSGCIGWMYRDVSDGCTGMYRMNVVKVWLLAVGLASSAMLLMNWSSLCCLIDGDGGDFGWKGC